MTSKELLERLQRHYIKPGQDLPGGIFLPEVGFNGAYGASRRCDAIYAGFTSASGRLLVGHELKVSRADWLHELASIGKSDAWADQCHEWWLVTLPGVVQDGELPDGWGLMVPGTSKTRMKVVTPAKRYTDRVPSWDAVRSIMSRQDTLRANAIRTVQSGAAAQAYEDAQERIEQQVTARLAQMGSIESIRAERDAYREALGGRLVEDTGRRWGGNHTAADLQEAATFLRAASSVQDAVDDMLSRYGSLEHLRKDFDALEKAIKDALGADSGNA